MLFNKKYILPNVIAFVAIVFILFATLNHFFPGAIVETIMLIALLTFAAIIMALMAVTVISLFRGKSDTGTSDKEC